MRQDSRQSTRDRGVAQVLLMRLENERLPFALKLKEKVDRGERLSSFDMQFLKRVSRESGEARRLAEKLPQYKDVVQRMTDLYEAISSKALENEKNPAPAPKPSDDFH